MRLFTFPVALVLLSSAAVCQYVIPQTVTANGGSTAVSGSYVLHNSVGQPISGPAGTTNGVLAGFWRGAVENDSALPVQLLAHAASVADGTVSIRWTTALEAGNHGFEIRRRRIRESNSGDLTSWSVVGFVEGAGTSPAPKEYEFAERLSIAGQYAYRIDQIDIAGSSATLFSTEITIVPPKSFALSQNYPNPFNPATAIAYEVSQQERVRLTVYDLTGREVEVLMNEEREPGRYEVWWNAGNLASGLYFYRLQAGSFMETRKLLLVR